MQLWVVQGPVACGRLHANWTYAELVAYLHQRQGIRVSRRAVCNFARRPAFIPYRPTYHFLRGNPQKQQAAKQQLQQLKLRIPSNWTALSGPIGPRVPGQVECAFRSNRTELIFFGAKRRSPLGLSSRLWGHPFLSSRGICQHEAVASVHQAV